MTPRRRPAGRPLVLILAVAVLLAGCATPEEQAGKYLTRAQALYDAGDYRKARLEAQNALQVAPKNAPARYLLALLAEKREEWREMLGHLAVAIDADPAYVPARTKLGLTLFLLGDYNGAAEQADAAAALAPDDPAVALLQARLQFYRAGPEAGQAALAEVVARFPGNAEAVILEALTLAETDPDGALARLTAAEARVEPRFRSALGEARTEILYKAGRFGELEQLYRELIATYPQRDYDLRLARFYVEQGRPAEAESLLRETIRREPDDVDNRLALARLLAALNRPDDVILALNEALAAIPGSLELPMALAEFYEGQERPADARAVYQGLAARSPKSAEGLEARTRLVVLQFAAGETQAGFDALNGILAEAPDHPAALLLRGDLQLQAQRYQDAIADLRTAVRRKPELARAWLLMGQAHAAIGEPLLAEEAFRGLLAQDPNNLEGLEQFGGLLFGLGKLPEAEEIHRRFLALEPGRPGVLARFVDVLLAQGKVAEAEAMAGSLAAIDGQTLLADLQLARVRQAQGRHGEAARLYQSVVEQSPASARALEGVVESLGAAGRQPEAIAWLRQFSARHPDQVLARLYLANGLGASGERDEARQMLEAILRANPTLGTAYLSLAALAPDPEARQAVLQRGLEALPNDAPLTVVLGTDYLTAGRVDDAIRLFEDTLEARPGSIIIRNNLAALLLDHREDRGSWERALALVQPLAGTSDPIVLDTLGWAHYRLGQFREAIDLLERAVAAADAAVSHYHLGMAYAGAGDPRARQQLEAAVRRAGADTPEGRAAKDTLEKLPGGRS